MRYLIEFSGDELLVVNEALDERPFKVAAPVVAVIQRQVLAQNAEAAAKTLDDYEEGTWTPSEHEDGARAEKINKEFATLLVEAPKARPAAAVLPAEPAAATSPLVAS